MQQSAKREYLSMTSEGQLTLGAPCCRCKLPTTVIFLRHLRL